MVEMSDALIYYLQGMAGEALGVSFFGVSLFFFAMYFYKSRNFLKLLLWSFFMFFCLIFSCGHQTNLLCGRGMTHLKTKQYLRECA